MGVAHQIAKFATELDYVDLTPASIHEVKRRLIDSVACAMGAWTAEPVRIARRIASFNTSDIAATVWGTSHQAPLDHATFANGLQTRYLDFNDTYLSKEPAHPSDNIPAVLSVAEGFDLGGKAFILGTVIAYEVQCRLCDAYSIRSRGWDHVTYGAYSTVAGCGRILGFDEDQMVHALGLSGVPNNAMRQTRVGELSMWKGAAFANAARNGVFATQLAMLGMTGPSDVFEGQMGFHNQVARGDTFTLDTWGDYDTGYMINRTYIKKYSAEYHSQSAIDAALEIIDQRGGTFDPEEIAEIEIATFNASYEIIGGEPEKWRPQSRETADHSLPYITVAALVDGDITLDSYAEARYRDETLLAAVARTKVVPDAELNALYPEQGIPNRVTLRTTDGQEYVSRVDAPRGHALNPMSDEEVEEKFYTLVEPMLGARDTAAALELMWSLDEIEDLSDLTEALVL